MAAMEGKGNNVYYGQEEFTKVMVCGYDNHLICELSFTNRLL